MSVSALHKLAVAAAIGGFGVQRGHGFDGGINPFLFRLPFLNGSRNYAGSQSLGQDEMSPASLHVGPDVFGWIAGNGVAELDFWIADAMAADHRASGLHHLGKATRQDLLQDFQIPFSGKQTSASALSGRPPMAYTSLRELVAAIWPKV